jgi:hypothetical protein
VIDDEKPSHVACDLDWEQVMGSRMHRDRIGYVSPLQPRGLARPCAPPNVAEPEQLELVVEKGNRAPTALWLSRDFAR